MTEYAVQQMGYRYFLLMFEVWFITEDKKSACIFLCVVDGRTEFTFNEYFVVKSNTKLSTGKFSHPFSAYIISQPPQFSIRSFSFCLFWIHTCFHMHCSSSFMVSFVFLCYSPLVSVNSFIDPQLNASFPTPPTQEWIQVSQFHLGHASCLHRSIRILGNGLLSSSRAFSFGQLGLFALTLKLLLGVCERGDGLERYGAFFSCQTDITDQWQLFPFFRFP